MQMGLIDIDTTLEKIIDIIEDRVKEETTKEPPPRLTITFIKEQVAKGYSVDVFHMVSHSRKRVYVEPRQVAMYLCTELCDPDLNTLKVIGREFGGRDHSTVIYSRQTVNDLMDSDKKYKIRVLAIKEKIIAEFEKQTVSL